MRSCAIWRPSTIPAYSNRRPACARPRQCLDGLAAQRLGPAITPLFIGLIRTPPEKRNPAVIEDSKKKTIDAMVILDAALAKSAYVAGDAFSYGDIPPAVMANRYRQLLPERPALPHFERWFAAIATRPGFRDEVAAVPLA